MRYTFSILIIFIALGCEVPQQAPSPGPGFKIIEAGHGVDIVIQANGTKDTTHTSTSPDALDHLHIPAQSFVITSQTYWPYFELLGLDSLVIGAPVYPGQADEMKGVQNVMRGEELDLEQVLSLEPAVLLHGGMPAAQLSRLESRGIRCIAMVDFLEGHPLERLAWLELIGLLTGHSDDAKEILQCIGEDYHSLIAEPWSTERPRVVLGSYYMGQWSLAGPESLMAHLLEDAGAEYGLEGEDTGSRLFSPEEMMQILQEIDYLGIIHFGSLERSEVLAWDTRLKLSGLANKHIFYCDVQSSDYFTSGIIEPHLILAELKAIMRGEKGEGPYFISLEK